MKVAVISFPGSVAVDQMVALVEAVGHEGAIVSSKKDDLSDFHAVIVPDGNAYGNAIRPGAIAQFDSIIKALRTFNEENKLIIGVGNGFQILTEANLLPGYLGINAQLKQINQEVTVSLNQSIFSTEETTLSVANKFGRYVIAEDELERLKDQNQILMTYNQPVFGSTEQIAGIMNAEKNVFGMMVLPERHMDEAKTAYTGGKLLSELLERG